jgi:uncharacterized DUF497 family protein
MQFEWDPKKAALNLLKHRVSFSEAATVFDDPGATIFDDPDHSIIEHRELIVGTSELARILIVSFTQRGSSTRIISARPASRKERTKYEEQHKTFGPAT